MSDPNNHLTMFVIYAFYKYIPKTFIWLKINYERIFKYISNEILQINIFSSSHIRKAFTLIFL